jgi:hypothetical protein
MSREGNFFESFKKSFELYVESGMRKKTEADLDTFRNEQDGFRVTEGFQAEFCKFITEHHLCKFFIYF